MARADKYSEQELEHIAKIKSKKNARLKKRRAKNKKLREEGKKFCKVKYMGALWEKDAFEKLTGCEIV